MTIPVSTVPAVLAYLKATLRTYINDDPNPQDIYLCVGDPGMQDPPDIINLAGVTRTLPHMAMVGSGGALALEENYDIDVIVSASMSGEDADVISPLIIARAWQLQAYVEDAVRQDPSLGTQVLWAWPTGGTGGTPKWAPPTSQGDVLGMLCEITSKINVDNSL
jgi:hypothetical protein